MHLSELADAIVDIKLEEQSSEYRLVADQQYLCKTVNAKLPLLPAARVGKEANQLFEWLVLTARQGPLNFEQMAMKWCYKVVAANIFPKLPVYLHTVGGSKIRECMMLWTGWHPVRQGSMR